MNRIKGLADAEARGFLAEKHPPLASRTRKIRMLSDTRSRCRLPYPMVHLLHSHLMILVLHHIWQVGVLSVSSPMRTNSIELTPAINRYGILARILSFLQSSTNLANERLCRAKLLINVEGGHSRQRTSQSSHRCVWTLGSLVLALAAAPVIARGVAGRLEVVQIRGDWGYGDIHCVQKIRAPLIHNLCYFSWNFDKNKLF